MGPSTWLSKEFVRSIVPDVVTSFRASLSIFMLGALTVLGMPVTSVSASPSEVDINFAQLVFDYENHTNISPAGPSCSVDDTSAPCVGKETGDIVRFNNVVTAGGTSVDAVVETLVQADTRVRRYEAYTSSKVLANPSWFWVNLGIDEPGGTASFRLSFYRAGTYTGPGTGQAVTLRNIGLSAVDINAQQFVQFSEVQGYALTTDTELTFNPSLGRFTSSNTSDEEEFPERYQVDLTFSSLSSITFGFGRDRTSSSSNFAIAGLLLPFDGGTVEQFGPVVAESPDPLVGPVDVPAIGFTTTPATTPADWDVLPECGTYLPGGTGPLTGTLQPGTYLTRCVDGSSAAFTPTEYIDGELLVTGDTPGPGPSPGPDPGPGPGPGPRPDPTPATPAFTG